jgi:hypothetical protein
MQGKKPKNQSVTVKLAKHNAEVGLLTQQAFP